MSSRLEVLGNSGSELTAVFAALRPTTPHSWCPLLAALGLDWRLSSFVVRLGIASADFSSLQHLLNSELTLPKHVSCSLQAKETADACITAGRNLKGWFESSKNCAVGDAIAKSHLALKLQVADSTSRGEGATKENLHAS